MQHIQGISRHQLQMISLEDKITADNPIRFIDAFVNTIDLQKIGFISRVLKKEGRPSFDTKVFLKIYLYGYLNGIRSSRRLEKECFRNIELQWLLEAICPNYHSIADFRKENPQALKKLFKLFVLFLKDADLISGDIIAIDGTKSRAHNSKKANYNQKKIDKHLAYIDEKSQEYLDQLTQNDCQENVDSLKNIQQKIERLKQNKIKYELLEEQLQASGGYSSGEALAYLHKKNINAYIPNFGQYKPEREGFTFNKEENYYQCTKPEGNQAKLLFKGEKTDSKGYTKRTYRTSESDCKNCLLREQCCGKSTKFKKLDDSIHKEHYDRMHQKLTQHAKYAKKMSRIRSKTVEPVIGTLVNFTNMKCKAFTNTIKKQ